MSTHPLSDRPGQAADGDLICLDPTCVVCWLSPRTGESRAEWLARLATRPDPQAARAWHPASPRHPRRTPPA